MVKQGVIKEVYLKQKQSYVLKLSQAPHWLTFMNIKKCVDYINRLGLFKDQELADYQAMVALLRSGKSWNYISAGLVLELRQVAVYGVKIKSARSIKSKALIDQKWATGSEAGEAVLKAAAKAKVKRSGVNK